MILKKKKMKNVTRRKINLIFLFIFFFNSPIKKYFFLDSKKERVIHVITQAKNAKKEKTKQKQQLKEKKKKKGKEKE